MSIEVKNLLMFGTPLFVSQLDLPEENVFLENFIRESENNDENPHPYCLTGYTTYKGKNVLDLNELKDFKELLLSITYEIHNDLSLTGSLHFADSWLTINRKHSYHNAHHHLPSCWSGVYYVKADKEDSKISFLNKPLVDSAWPYKDVVSYNKFNSLAYDLSVETGRLLIFPSYIYHEVEEQITNNERITLAFNIDVRD